MGALIGSIEMEEPLSLTLSPIGGERGTSYTAAPAVPTAAFAGATVRLQDRLRAMPIP